MNVTLVSSILTVAHAKGAGAKFDSKGTTRLDWIFGHGIHKCIKRRRQTRTADELNVSTSQRSSLQMSPRNTKSVLKLAMLTALLK